MNIVDEKSSVDVMLEHYAWLCILEMERLDGIHGQHSDEVTFGCGCGPWPCGYWFGVRDGVTIAKQIALSRRLVTEYMMKIAYLKGQKINVI